MWEVLKKYYKILNLEKIEKYLKKIEKFNFTYDFGDYRNTEKFFFMAIIYVRDLIVIYNFMWFHQI